MNDDSAELVRTLIGAAAYQGVELPDGRFAWSANQCMQVLHALRASRVAVLSGEFYLMQPIGLVPAFEGWSCEPTPGETATDFALRSREVAASNVRNDTSANRFVVLRLSGQDEAA